MSMRVKAINSFEGLADLQSPWELYQNHPNNDFEHYRLVCRLRREVESPYVMIVERDGQISAMLIGRIERLGFCPCIGYFRPLQIPTKTLSVVYQGLLGNTDTVDCKLLVQHIWSFLEIEQADMATFHDLPNHLPLLKALEASYPRRFCHKTKQSTAHWTMTLPLQPEFLLRQKYSKRRSHQSWISSRLNKLQFAYPGKVTWQWIKTFDDFTNIACRLDLVAARTYQRKLGAGFVNDEEHRQRYKLFSDRGQLRIQTVEIEGEIKAFWIGTVYQNVFYSSETAYDPNFRAYELGTLVFFAMTDHLVREGVSKIDFGLGDAFYKKSYGDESWMETTVTLFAPNPKGRLIHAISVFFATIDNISRSFLQKAGTLDRVRTGLRRLIQPKSRGE